MNILFNWNTSQIVNIFFRVIFQRFQYLSINLYFSLRHNFPTFAIDIEYTNDDKIWKVQAPYEKREGC